MSLASELVGGYLRDVQACKTSLLARLIAMLCIAIILLFAGMSMSSAMDRVQHAPSAPIEHEHMLFGDLSLELDHADDHHGSQPDDSNDDPAGQLAGGHHHHADGASGMIVPNQTQATMLSLAADMRAFETQRQSLGIKARGPERPPKVSIANA